jgi:membrane protease YdiL (CAAX protease family)
MTDQESMPQADPPYRRAPARHPYRDFLKYLGMFFVWNIGASFALLAGLLLKMPLLGLGFAFLIAVWMVRGYLLGGRGGARRRALIGVRPLSRAALRWTILAIPVMTLASWSLTEVWLRLVPVPPDSVNPFEVFTNTVAGKISISLLAVALAPLLEEFFFRGLIQSTLIRQNGPTGGIIVAAAAFAAAHFLPWIFPIHFFLGAAFGYAVYVTRSIWPGVILHASNNLAAVAGLVQSEAPEATPTIWTTGLTSDWWLALGGLALSVLLVVYTARGLREAGRLRPRARHP